MKELICAKDVEAYQALGNSTISINCNTIITPSARDLAESYKMTFLEGEAEQKSSTKESCIEEVSQEQLLDFLRKLIANGSLANFLPPYQMKKHGSGLKLVKGPSVKMDVFDTGNPKATVYFQELVSKEESKISAGFLTIDHSSFEWELTYEEIDYIIDGTVTVTIDGETFTAEAGDVLFVPKNSKVVWGSPNKGRLFYATYPADWADQ